MSKRNHQDSKHISEAVMEYVANNGVTSLDEIAAYVYGRIGIEPSKSTVSRILQEAGHIPTTRRVWSYQHNPGK